MAQSRSVFMRFSVALCLSSARVERTILALADVELLVAAFRDVFQRDRKQCEINCISNLLQSEHICYFYMAFASIGPFFLSLVMPAVPEGKYSH